MYVKFSRYKITDTDLRHISHCWFEKYSYIFCVYVYSHLRKKVFYLPNFNSMLVVAIKQKAKKTFALLLFCYYAFEK